MSCIVKAGFSVSGSCDFRIENRAKGSVVSSIGILQFKELNSKEFLGKTLDLSSHKAVTNFDRRTPKLDPVHAQTLVSFGKPKWWEKTLHPNMIEIQSAQELADHLLNAGDRLVVVDFYSPGCGGCKSLHPKICQMAESNPDVTFLTVNYEDHKEMCYALHVHVLPFFRFYRGSEGRVCSFSCTLATIKKFRDALAKYGGDRSTSGAATGLNEKELVALASIGQISEDMVPSSTKEEKFLVLSGSETSNALSKDKDKTGGLKEGKNMVMV